MTDTPAALPPPLPRTWPALLGAVAVVVIVALIGMVTVHLPDRAGAKDYAALLAVYVTARIGLGLVADAVIVWALLYFLYVRRRRPQAGTGHFMILFAAAALTAVAASPLVIAKAQAAHDNELKAIARTYVAADTISAADYAGRMDAVGAAAMLTPEALAAHPDIAGERASLKAAHGVIAARRAAIARLQDAARKQLRGLGMTEGHRQAAMGGFEGSISSAWPLTAQRLDLDDKTLSETDKALAVLSRSRWTVVKGQLTFLDSRVAAVYGPHADNLVALAAQAREVDAALTKKRYAAAAYLMAQ